PIWKADPLVVKSTEVDEGPFGVKWSRVIRVEAPGVGVVQATLKREGEKPAVRFLPVVDGRVAVVGSGCGTTFPATLPPGDYTLELALLDGAGQPGEVRSLPFVMPEHRLR
ncbi:MAG: hypothetical protein R3F43_23585, partial [bacterium]